MEQLWSELFLGLMQNEVTVGRLPDKADIVIPVATGHFTF